MRGRVLQYDAGFTVINDCYNSNPVALAAQWSELLTNTPAAGRHILAAGEMLELGPASARIASRGGARGCSDRKIVLDHRRAR